MINGYISNQLIGAKNDAQHHLNIQRDTLDDLDELGEIMTGMLDRQQVVEVSLSQLNAVISTPFLSDGMP